MARDVSDVCEKLQGVQLQLHLVLNRNEEVLKHLEEAEKIVLEDGSSEDKELFTKNLQYSRSVSKKLKESIETQCTSLTNAVKELELRTAEDDTQSTSKRTPRSSRASLMDQKSSLEFQLKTQLNHNVQLHQDKAELETRLREHMNTLKESGKQADKLDKELVETKAQIKKLLDMFEGKAAEAEKRILELQGAMDESHERAQKFQEMYESEKETTLRLEKEQRERVWAAVENGAEDEEDGLGPVLLSRPQTSVNRTKTTSINPQAIDPLYQSVIEENKKLKAEVDRLRTDNTHLVTRSKQAQRDIETIQNHVATCSTQRDELRRRLKKEQEGHRKLSSSLNRQASDWIMQKKMVKDIDHYNKVGKGCSMQ